MELTYYGRSCVRIRGREATIAYDPYTSIVGPTGRGMTADIVTLSHPDDAPLSRVKGRLAPRDGRTPIATSLDAAIVLEGPGEYEVKSVLITGVRSYRDAHRGPAARHNTIFCAEIDGVHVVHLGDYAEGLGNEQLKELPGSDVVLVPVGGGLSGRSWRVPVLGESTPRAYENQEPPRKTRPTPADIGPTGSTALEPSYSRFPSRHHSHTFPCI